MDTQQYVKERRVKVLELQEVQCTKCGGANLKAGSASGLAVWECSCGTVFPRMDTECYDECTGLVIQPWQDRRTAAHMMTN